MQSWIHAMQDGVGEKFVDLRRCAFQHEDAHPRSVLRGQARAPVRVLDSTRGPDGARNICSSITRRI